MTISRRIITLLICCLTPICIWSQIAERLPYPINTDEFDEVSPVLSADDSQLFFSRLGYPEFDRTLISGNENLFETLTPEQWRKRLKIIYSQLAGQNINFPVRSVYNQDIWIAQLLNHKVTKISHPAFPLNSALPNGVLAYWDDQNELILLNQFFENGSMNDGLSRFDLSQSKTLPNPLYIYDFYTFSSDVQASISPEGDILILAIQREDALGNQDLYISYRSGKDIWSAPENLGSSLNTPFRESTPYLSKDKRRLFFASDRPGGMGGMDIYVSQRIGPGWSEWTKPKRLGPPINSSSNDSNPCFSGDGAFLYFSSTRGGSSDIFRFALDFEPTYESKNCLIEIFVRDGNSNKLVPSTLYYRKEQESAVKYKLNAQSGKAILKINDDQPLTLFAEANKYEKVTKEVFPAEWSDRDTIFLDLLLFPILTQSDSLKTIKDRHTDRKFKIPIYKKALLKKGERVKESYMLDHIQFEPKSAILKSGSTKGLMELTKKLLSDTSLHLIVEGHTDNGHLPFGASAQDIYKKKKSLTHLSQERAETVKSFLVREGIRPDRIRTIGMGSKHPLNDNSNDLERQMNRRVEIIICKRG